MEAPAPNDNTLAPHVSAPSTVPPRGRGRDGRGGQRGERGRGGNQRGRGRSGAGRGGMHNQLVPQGPLGQAPMAARPVPIQNANGTNEVQNGEEKSNTAQNGAEDDEEFEVCFICAGPVVHNSVSPCNHRTCHICALRMRALYKNRACMHCRVSLHRA